MASSSSATTSASARAPPLKRRSGRLSAPPPVVETPNDGRPAVWRAADTETAGWTYRDTYATANQILTSHEAAGRRESNGRQGAVAGGCTRQGHSTRRSLSSPSMRGITSTIRSSDRAAWSSSSSSWQIWCHLRPSRPGWPWAASLACARKAHNVAAQGIRDPQQRPEGGQGG